MLEFLQIINEIISLDFEIKSPIGIFFDEKCQVPLDIESFSVLHYFQELNIFLLFLNIEMQVFSIKIQNQFKADMEGLNPFILKAINKPICLSSNRTYIKNKQFFLEKDNINNILSNIVF